MKDTLQKIYDYALEEIMGERFGRYSKYIIQDRAIPDVRDGLKPVQRRILFAMYKQKWTHDKPYNKSAYAVGEVMGKYHPHGDSSIYEAMVRMSQSWKLRAPLIDMQGNNGSIDGDSPAAQRYTEARLSKISSELLRDLDKNTVIMAPNYDDKLLEPTVLPAKFPNLLVNGATGISAGYATNIPPHNLGEIIEATIKLIEDENTPVEEIMTIVKGPDFPTGGIIEGIDGIKEAYTTGRGKIIVKSKIDIETNKGKDQLVITEIPYEVNKALLVKKMDDIRIEKKIDGIADVRDESDKDGLRIAVYLKKDADSTLILNYLLKNTDLQISYNFNMVSIVNRRPRLLGIREMLIAYIAHQKEVITKRTEFDLEHAKARFHIVEGLIKALSILDEVIAVIRKSKNKADAEDNLVMEFAFSKLQAEAIVTLQLYRLSNTDVTSLEEELKNLVRIIKGLNKILDDKNVLMSVIIDELRKIKEEYSTPRLTGLKAEVTEIKIDTTSLIPKEDVIVVVTKEGYVKRVSLRSYNASEDDTLVKEGDYIIGLYEMNTLDTILLFTDLGNYLYVPVYEIPDTKWRELGKHISNIIGIKADENVIGSVPVYNFDDEIYITTFTKNGMIKRTKLGDYKVSRYSKPLVAIKLKDDDKVTNITSANDSNILIVTKNGYALWYDIDEVPVTGPKASGVKSIKLKDDYVIDGTLFNTRMEYIALFTNKGTGKRVRLKDLERTTRARKGVLIIREVKTNPHKVLNAFVTDSKGLFGVKTTKDIITIKASELTIMDRYSTGTSIYKGTLIDAFEVCTLKDASYEVEEEIVVEEDNTEETEYKQLSLLDIDDNLNKVDDILNMTKKDL
ncbi:MAG: DNA topoisomerase IV subunit A [Bacilli bacterium]|mgnify:CR=1 FL=1|nr:DNA topoisomerase IV subunit A [Bacilli bacterium]MDD3304631.1 DNA topoisomerase IV subunit A [Bacilli bacterium]MDD4053544.1 DNA topoisomerase IV subunit A [Bacilli bacterium]MDD4411489.1 DNA topoisomerase IV subunit A [Bacilli bacterium]